LNNLSIEEQSKLSTARGTIFLGALTGTIPAQENPGLSQSTSADGVFFPGGSSFPISGDKPHKEEQLSADKLDFLFPRNALAKHGVGRSPDTDDTDNTNLVSGVPFFDDHYCSGHSFETR